MEEAVDDSPPSTTHEQTHASTSKQKGIFKLSNIIVEMLSMDSSVAPLFRKLTEEEIEEVAQAVGDKWRLFGRKLEIDGKYLRDIANDCDSIVARCSSLFFKRLASGELKIPGDHPFTSETMINTLSQINEPTLTRNLREKIQK